MLAAFNAALNIMSIGRRAGFVQKGTMQSRATLRLAEVTCAGLQLRVANVPLRHVCTTKIDQRWPPCAGMHI